MHHPDETYLNQEADNTSRFESDTQRLMHRHLQDKDHVITDEELKNLRVGMAPAQPTDATGTTIPVEPPVVPWDTLEQ